MKQLLIRALIALTVCGSALPGASFAQKISADPTASALAGGEYLAGVQTGINVKVLPSQILTYALANIHSVNSQTGTSYTYLSSDRGKLVTHSNASSISAGLPQATGSFASGWFMLVQNRGAGTLTITPTTSTIDGSASLALTAGQGAFIISDGTNWYTFRSTPASVSAAGSTKQIQYNAAGALGAEAGFEYDATTDTLTVANATTSGLALTAATSTGSSGFRLPHGTAPTSPVNGDVWTTTAGLYARINGSTVGPFGTGGAFTGGTLTSALNEAPTVTIASSGTVNIGAAAANSIDISGTTTITAFDTIAAGAVRVLKFSGALTLTHNGTTLALPGAANITTANGDYAAFQSRGGGNWYCMWYMRATGLPLVASGGALTNFTEAVSTATPNATVPVVSLVATNAATNADAAFMPKGTGALTARVADNGSTNGNKRGTSAVDWQRDLNGDATAVAAGTGSVIGGGLGNKVNSGSAQATIAGGYTNNVSGGSQGAIAGGRTNNVSSNYGAIGGGISNVASTSNYTTVGGGNSNTASGTAATVPGGDTNVADATSSIAMGANATTRTMMGSAAFSSTTALGLGKRQVKRAILTGSTTDAATAKILTVNNTTAGTTNQFCLPTGSTLRLRGVLAFRNSSGGDAGSVTVDGQVKNVSGTVSLSGTPVIGTYMGDSSLSTVAVTMTADNTNKCAAVTVNGVAATNIDHVAVFDALETTN